MSFFYFFTFFTLLKSLLFYPKPWFPKTHYIQGQNPSPKVAHSSRQMSHIVLYFVVEQRITERTIQLARLGDSIFQLLVLRSPFLYGLEIFTALSQQCAHRSLAVYLFLPRVRMFRLHSEPYFLDIPRICFTGKTM